MNAPTRRPLSSLLLVFTLCACSEPSGGDDDDAGTDGVADVDDSGPSETTSDIPPCDPDACTAQCQLSFSECGQPLTGSCVANTCECAADPCAPCLPENCGPYETCSSEFGTCSFACYAALPFVVDPPGSCQMLLPGYPPGAIEFVGVSFDSQELAHVADCAQESTLAWTWLADDAGVMLCPQACLAYESATLPLLELGCPPD